MDILFLLRQWLESIEVRTPLVAHFLCKIIPASCPFEREIKIFKHTILAIPPLCKFNPFYEQIMLLRFKALTYLVEQCNEDIGLYC